MQTFTWEQLMTAVLVVGALIGAYNLIVSAIKNHREQKALKDAPIDAIKTKLTDHDEKLDRDKRRLDKIEEVLDKQSAKDAEIADGLNVLMRGFLAMTRHMRHGNNVDGLDKSEQEITDYLTGNRGNGHD